MKELFINTLSNLYYANVLRTMVQHVKRKCPLLRNGFLLHHNNARPHIARCVLGVLQQNNVETLPHPPYTVLISLHVISGCFINLRNHYEANVFQATNMSKGCGGGFETTLAKRTFTCF
ncbi:histone-lysine N-methyltransferase SETMAR [Trichonephila clavipes]|uniref:Histone-lysine N-methyltransferase SETMAR n=1 Tax=Trichonephila clavipes TaxID=2585209 RepID=A0A8X6W4P6_TRICX|nr:histone-lysine N-methyltransferase SETMAR [Trichonephila clavipes]